MKRKRKCAPKAHKHEGITFGVRPPPDMDTPLRCVFGKEIEATERRTGRKVVIIHAEAPLSEFLC